MVLRALKYSAIAGIAFWILLGFLLICGGYTAKELAVDGHKLPPLSDQLMGALFSLSISVGMFTIVGLISAGVMKAIEFVKRTIGLT